MKKNVLNLITFVLILVGCTNAEDSSLQIEKNGPNYVSSIINVDEAIEISHKVLKHSHVTRNVTLGSPVVDYVLNGNVSKTRNASLRDTLAYVINYPNDEGFVIVSSDRRVYPVLAYSDKGNFSFSNEAVKSTFINNIGNYISSADATVSYEVNDNDFQSCYSQTPMIEAEFSQGSPWNKYVIKEHPNCPAGCVALATSLVLSHSMTYVYNYHGLKFNFKSILKPIIKAQNPYDKKVIDLTDPWESVQQPEYSYQQAVDSMALFIYWIGKDLNTKYGIDESSASSADAYNLCRRLRNGEITNCEKFNLEDICKYVKDKYIVYLWGYDIKGKGGHAWVCDGCSYCVDYNHNNNIKNCYIHCDWGWGGSDNGFYTGDVFKALDYNIRPTDYFALKRGNYYNNNASVWLDQRPFGK